MCVFRLFWPRKQLSRSVAFHVRLVSIWARLGMGGEEDKQRRIPLGVHLVGREDGAEAINNERRGEMHHGVRRCAKKETTFNRLPYHD